MDRSEIRVGPNIPWQIRDLTDERIQIARVQPSRTDLLLGQVVVFRSMLKPLVDSYRKGSPDMELEKKLDVELRVTFRDIQVLKNEVEVDPVTEKVVESSVRPPEFSARDLVACWLRAETLQKQRTAQSAKRERVARMTTDEVLRKYLTRE